MIDSTAERSTFIVPDWLTPDTEESVVGTQWHQEAVGALASMLVEVGRRHGLAWGVARGIALLGTGARYSDGKPYDPKPDVMVLPHPLADGDITGVSLSDGAPLFIAEVVSKSTSGDDLGFKKEVYECARIPEYVTFDPSGHIIAPVLHAWRLEGAANVPWVAGEDGWWHSRALDITLRPTPPFLTIRDRTAREVSLPRRALEREARLEQLEQDLAEAQRRIAEMEDQLRRLHGE